MTALHSLDTWIVVADAARASVYAAVDLTHRWRLVRKLAHPESRDRPHDVLSDRAGRSMHTGRYGSPMSSRSTLHETEARKFAHDLAKELEAGLLSSAYASLVIVAPPAFLGALRRELSPGVARKVSRTVTADYSKAEPRRIAALMRA